MQIEEVQAILTEYAKKYDPLLTIKEAAALSKRPIATVYDWSSRGYFDEIKSSRGREIRLFRDGFVRFLLGMSLVPPVK